jgi:hypothetical protein
MPNKRFEAGRSIAAHFSRLLKLIVGLHEQDSNVVSACEKVLPL